MTNWKKSSPRKNSLDSTLHTIIIWCCHRQNLLCFRGGIEQTHISAVISTARHIRIDHRIAILYKSVAGRFEWCDVSGGKDLQISFKRNAVSNRVSFCTYNYFYYTIVNCFCYPASISKDSRSNIRSYTYISSENSNRIITAITTRVNLENSVPRPSSTSGSGSGAVVRASIEIHQSLEYCGLYLCDDVTRFA